MSGVVLAIRRVMCLLLSMMSYIIVFVMFMISYKNGASSSGDENGRADKNQIAKHDT